MARTKHSVYRPSGYNSENYGGISSMMEYIKIYCTIDRQFNSETVALHGILGHGILLKIP